MSWKQRKTPHGWKKNSTAGALYLQLREYWAWTRCISDSQLGLQSTRKAQAELHHRLPQKSQGIQKAKLELSQINAWEYEIKVQGGTVFASLKFATPCTAQHRCAYSANDRSFFSWTTKDKSSLNRKQTPDTSASPIPQLLWHILATTLNNWVGQCNVQNERGPLQRMHGHPYRYQSGYQQLPCFQMNQGWSHKSPMCPVSTPPWFHFRSIKSGPFQPALMVWMRPPPQ